VTTTRIYTLTRSDSDQPERELVATLEDPGSVEIVLSNWFDSEQPPPGSYFAENDRGQRYGTIYTAGRGLAA
jgi:hypothetical protein